MRSVIGIDEAGRGPIAGPVSVAAFTPRRNLQLSVSNFQKKNKVPLRDSKKLTELQREKWFAQIKLWQREGKCDFAVTLISAKKIDRIGINRAIQKALDHSLRKICLPNSGYSRKQVKILLDGGLRAPKEFTNQKTIIKGDEKEPAISLASICAKVTRDRHMVALAKKYPKYDLQAHKGYGTKKHYQAISKHGMSLVHRRSFLKNIKK